MKQRNGYMNRSFSGASPRELATLIRRTLNVALLALLVSPGASRAASKSTARSAKSVTAVVAKKFICEEIVLKKIQQNDYSIDLEQIEVMLKGNEGQGVNQAIVDGQERAFVIEADDVLAGSHSIHYSYGTIQNGRPHVASTQLVRFEKITDDESLEEGWTTLRLNGRQSADVYIVTHPGTMSPTTQLLLSNPYLTSISNYNRRAQKNLPAGLTPTTIQSATQVLADPIAQQEILGPLQDGTVLARGLNSICLVRD